MFYHKIKIIQIISLISGHWVHYGFGMACMYALDYRNVGGFTLGRAGWGGEDVDLYVKHVRSKLQVRILFLVCHLKLD